MTQAKLLTASNWAKTIGLPFLKGGFRGIWQYKGFKSPPGPSLGKGEFMASRTKGTWD